MCTFQQARVIFLLFGPCRESEPGEGARILWDDVSRSTLRTREQVLNCFQELGDVINLLEQHWVTGPDDDIAAGDELAHLLWHLFSVLLFLRVFQRCHLHR